MRKPTKRLQLYVRAQLAAGEAEDAIAQALSTRGWSEEEIQQALNSSRGALEKSDDGAPDSGQYSVRATTGRRTLPLLIGIGSVSLVTGIALKLTNELSSSWAVVCAGLVVYLGALWYFGRASTLRAIAVLLGGLVLLGAYYLFGFATLSPVGPLHNATSTLIVPARAVQK